MITMFATMLRAERILTDEPAATMKSYAQRLEQAAGAGPHECPGLTDGAPAASV